MLAPIDPDYWTNKLKHPKTRMCYVRVNLIHASTNNHCHRFAIAEHSGILFCGFHYDEIVRTGVLPKTRPPGE